MSFKDMYSLAYAPVQKTTLDNPENDLLDMYTLCEELEFMETFSTGGFQVFTNAIKHIMQECDASGSCNTEAALFGNDKIDCNGEVPASSIGAKKTAGKKNVVFNAGANRLRSKSNVNIINPDASYRTEEMSVALHCLLDYIDRLKAFCVTLQSTLDENILSEMPSTGITLSDLTSVAIEVGMPLDHQELSQILDTDADAEWIPPCSGDQKGKVGFSTNVDVYDGSNKNQKKSNQKLTTQTGYKRSQNRKATGYAKFDFSKDIDSDDSYQVEKVKGKQKNKKKNVADTARNKKVGKIIPTSSTENRANAKSSVMCGCCAHVDEDEFDLDAPLERKQSSVALGSVEEIEDAPTDEKWHEKQRHETRYARIRKRVPTGHPNLMKIRR